MALALGARYREFESLRPDSFYEQLILSCSLIAFGSLWHTALCGRFRSLTLRAFTDGKFSFKMAENGDFCEDLRPAV
jgi:hypothetical protein